MMFGIYSGDMDYCLGLPAGGRARRERGTPACPVRPEDFGIAPGMRAMKARLAKRRRPSGSVAHRAAVTRQSADEAIRQQRRAMADTKPNWDVCCHEAGHAVACVILGLRFHGPSVLPTLTGVQGGVAVDEAGASAQSLAIVAYAGAAAEARATGRASGTVSNADQSVAGLALDRHYARTPLARTLDAVRGIKASWKQGAAELVRLAWPAIDDLARELSVRSLVSEKTCRAIVARQIRLD